MHEKKYNLGWTDKLTDTQIYIYKGGNPKKEFTEKNYQRVYRSCPIIHILHSLEISDDFQPIGPFGCKM